MIMWDPATYPDVKTIADLGKAGVMIRYFGGAAYMDYFTQARASCSADQLDGSYDGTPGAVRRRPRAADAQQGFGSAEPYIYENEVAGLDEAGRLPVHQRRRLEELRRVDRDQAGEHRASTTTASQPRADHPAVERRLRRPTRPRPTARSSTRSTQFDNGWVYSQGVADYAVETMIKRTASSATARRHVGNFDIDRVNDLIEKAIPVYTRSVSLRRKA